MTEQKRVLMHPMDLGVAVHQECRIQGRNEHGVEDLTKRVRQAIALVTNDIDNDKP